MTELLRDSSQASPLPAGEGAGTETNKGVPSTLGHYGSLPAEQGHKPKGWKQEKAYFISRAPE